jgi:N-acetylmuramoyl-L-alanine amidase
LEPGFLTNKEDVEFFANENNMTILANRIYNGVVAWFNSYKQEHERIKRNQN